MNLLAAGLSLSTIVYCVYLYYWEKEHITIGTVEDDDDLADLIKNYNQKRSASVIELPQPLLIMDSNENIESQI